MVALLQSGTRGDEARTLLASDPVWVAPSHMPLEVLRTLHRYEGIGTLSPTAADAFAVEVTSAELRLAASDEELLAYVWRRRHNLSPYDAPYVALGERHGIALVTADARLARAARSTGVDAVVT